MKFAVNYTPQAAELLKTGAISFDLFKCPDWPDVVDIALQHHPVYVHFPLMTRPVSLQTVDWAQVERLLKQTGTHFVNMHVAPHAGDFPGMSQDTHDPHWRAKIMELVIRSIQTVVQRFGKEKIILENVPWDPDPKYAIPRPVIEPPFIQEVIAETGCGLLLDLAHARIAALHLGIDPIAYADSLPCPQLRELHITGTQYSDERQCWIDHFAMTDDDWLLAAYAMDHIRAGRWPQPEIIALEYGGVGPLFDWRSDSEVLRRDVSRLHHLIANG